MATKDQEFNDETLIRLARRALIKYRVDKDVWTICHSKHKGSSYPQLSNAERNKLIAFIHEASETILPEKSMRSMIEDLGALIGFEPTSSTACNRTDLGLIYEFVMKNYNPKG